MRPKRKPAVTSFGRSPGIIFLNWNGELGVPAARNIDWKISISALGAHSVPAFEYDIDPFPLTVKFQVLIIKQSIGASSIMNLTDAPVSKPTFSTEFKVH